MMLKIGSTAALGALCVLLAGCGASPTTGLDFKEPPGWQSTPSFFGGKVWINKANSNIVMLIKFAGKGGVLNASDLDFGSGKNPYVGSDAFQHKTALTICGSHPATLYHSTQSKAGDKSSDSDVLMTAWGSDMYLAIYSHPHGSAADPVAETSIRSVCLKK
jgi:hypothetical protein